MTVKRRRPLSLVPVLLVCHTPLPISPCPTSPLAHTPGEDRPEGTGVAQALLPQLGYSEEPSAHSPRPPLRCCRTSGEVVNLKQSLRWTSAFTTQMPSDGGLVSPSSRALGARPEAERMHGHWGRARATSLPDHLGPRLPQTWPQEATCFL